MFYTYFLICETVQSLILMTFNLHPSIGGTFLCPLHKIQHVFKVTEIFFLRGFIYF